MLDRRTFLVTSITSAVAGCAAPPSAAPKYLWGQVVDFEGLSFAVNAARSTKSFTYARNVSVESESGFVIVDISMTNKTLEPLRFEFQPVYRLMDDSGRLYEYSQHQTALINAGRRAGSNALNSINPGTALRREYVFEAPKGRYQLQVMVPSRLQMAFAGNIRKSGPYFLYDISSQL